MWNTLILCLFLIMQGPYASTDTDIREIKGRVLDSSGKALPGVNVLLMGTAIGTVTDETGSFVLAVPEGTITLYYAFNGFQQLKQQLSMNKDFAWHLEITLRRKGVRTKSSAKFIRII